MRRLINLAVALAFVFASISCNLPQPPAPVQPKVPEVSQPAPAPLPPVVSPTVVKKTPRPVIYVDKKSGKWGLNKAGMDLMKSGRCVVHIQYGYIYNIASITESGDEILEYHDWYPTSVDKITVGLYDTVTGKYLASVRVI